MLFAGFLWFNASHFLRFRYFAGYPDEYIPWAKTGSSDRRVSFITAGQTLSTALLHICINEYYSQPDVPF